MSMLAQLAKIPAPLFGTAATFVQYGRATSRKLPGLVAWSFPAVVGGLWFLWPAIDEEWKQSIGLGNRVVAASTPAPPKEPQLDAAALAKVELAYKAGAVEEEADEDENEDADMSLEEIWDRDLFDPGDVDDDDDDDDDDDEDEEDEDDEDDDE